jgi:hypothetical protein
LYQPTSFLDGLIKASAVIGALSLCYQAYTTLLAAPEVSVNLEAAQPIDASPSSPVTIPLSLTNHAGSASARVEFADITSTVPTTGIDFGENYFEIPPGERKEAKLTGHTGEPGDIRLRIVARARAGRFRFARDIPVTADIRVWPALQLGRFETLASDCTDGQCVSRALLHVGRTEANGFDCWAQVVGVPDVTIRAIRTSVDGGIPSVAGMGAARVAKIEWHEPSVDAFHDRRVDLVMAGKISQNSWPGIINGVRWLCDPATRAGGT